VSLYILTNLPPYLFPCRTEPQSNPMVPVQDGPSEKLDPRLATEALSTNSWEKSKACRELGPARARRWDAASSSQSNSKFNFKGQKWSLPFWPHLSSLFYKLLFWTHKSRVRNVFCGRPDSKYLCLWTQWCLSQLLKSAMVAQNSPEILWKRVYIPEFQENFIYKNRKQAGFSPLVIVYWLLP
jgi:hypothetical protein